VNWVCPTAQSRSLLHLSVLHENIECIELLVQRGADVNIKDQNNDTPLHFAAQKVSFFIILISHSHSLIFTHIHSFTHSLTHSFGV
jgi:hypothetical protein